jgi:transcriptional regulator with XRE-family HTH domain
MNIGERVKQIRERQGMMQKDLALKVGLSTARISELEKKKSCPTSTLERICKALDITPSFFYSDEDVSPEDTSLKELIKDIGMDYLVFSKEMKDSSLSIDELRKTISQLKSLGLLKNQ